MGWRGGSAEEGLHSLPSTHMAAHNHLVLWFQGIRRPLLVSNTHVVHIHTCSQNTHTLKSKNTYKKITERQNWNYLPRILPREWKNEFN